MQDVGSLGRLNELEQENLEALKKELRGSIQKGIDFVASGKAGTHLPHILIALYPALALDWQWLWAV